MTEAEWLACDDPARMLQFISRYTSRRKELLFSAACCRRVEKFLLGDCRRLLAALEQQADARLPVSECVSLHHEAVAASGRLYPGKRTPKGFASWHAGCAVSYGHERNPAWASRAAASAVACDRASPRQFDASSTMGLTCEGDPEELAAHAALLRHVVGNPFRPVTADPSWLTPTAVALAEGIYEEKAFERLPILADALEEAGCADPDLLGHLRSPGPHVRGCWALDLVLGKG
jgi:hypothetical protein